MEGRFKRELVLHLDTCIKNYEINICSQIMTHQLVHFVTGNGTIISYNDTI